MLVGGLSGVESFSESDSEEVFDVSSASASSPNRGMKSSPALAGSCVSTAMLVVDDTGEGLVNRWACSQ